MTRTAIKKGVKILIICLLITLAFGCSKQPAVNEQAHEKVLSEERTVTQNPPESESQLPHGRSVALQTEETNTGAELPADPKEATSNETYAIPDPLPMEQTIDPKPTQPPDTGNEVPEEEPVKTDPPVISPENEDIKDDDEEVTEDPPVVSEETPPVAPHVHEYTCECIPPTCESVGYTVYHCGCGEYYDADYIPALGHEWVADYEEQTVEITELQCHTFCGVCGLDLTAAGMSVDEILDHTEWHAIHGEGSRRYEEWVEVVIGYEVETVQIGAHCTRCGITK